MNTRMIHRAAQATASVMAALLAALFAPASCQSTAPVELGIPEPAIVDEGPAVEEPRYLLGMEDSGLKEPPAYLQELMETGAEPAVGSLPRWESGFITFAVKAPGALAVKLWMSGLQPYLADDLKVGEGGWFWRTYSLPEDREISYLYEVRDSAGVMSYLKDPANPAVLAKPPYNNLHDPEGGSRLEFLELPYDLAGRAKPDKYEVKVRRMLVWVPSGYDADSSRRYPVVYMQDGQNAWDSSAANFGGWKADRVMDQLLASGEVEPAIIVSIFNTSYRTDEYAGAGFQAAGRDPSGRMEAIAEYYRDWCVEVLKPEIDKRYRTLSDRANTAVMGSSYGGCITVYWSLSKPEIFGRAAALSYAPGDEKSLDGGMTALTRDQYLPALSSSKIPRPRLWLDCGTAGLDGQLAPQVTALDEVLRSGGYAQGADYHYELFAGADHNEAAWFRRLPQILKFLLPPKK